VAYQILVIPLLELVLMVYFNYIFYCFAENYGELSSNVQPMISNNDYGRPENQA
jgi:hypothetical protein